MWEWAIKNTPMTPSSKGLGLEMAVAAESGMRLAATDRSKVQWIEPWALLGGGNVVGSLMVPLTYAKKK
jgi:hypothetical protein